MRGGLEGSRTLRLTETITFTLIDDARYRFSSHSVHAVAKVSKLQTKTMNALIVIDVHAKESDSVPTKQWQQSLARFRMV